MPRKNRPQKRRKNSAPRKNNGPGVPDRTAELLGLDTNYSHETDSVGGWHVRQVPAWRAVKTYTCPNCLRDIPQGQAHVVAWRSDWIFGDEQAGEYRRHWHSGCWKNRRQDMR